MTTNLDSTDRAVSPPPVSGADRIVAAAVAFRAVEMSGAEFGCDEWWGAIGTLRSVVDQATCGQVLA